MNISLKPTCQIPLGYFLLHYKLSLQAFEGSVQITDLCKQYAIVTEFISNQQPLCYNHHPDWSPTILKYAKRFVG